MKDEQILKNSASFSSLFNLIKSKKKFYPWRKIFSNSKIQYLKICHKNLTDFTFKNWNNEIFNYFESHVVSQQNLKPIKRLHPPYPNELPPYPIVRRKNQSLIFLIRAMKGKNRFLFFKNNNLNKLQIIFSTHASLTVSAASISFATTTISTTTISATSAAIT